MLDPYEIFASPEWVPVTRHSWSPARATSHVQKNHPPRIPACSKQAADLASFKRNADLLHQTAISVNDAKRAFSHLRKIGILRVLAVFVVLFIAIFLFVLVKDDTFIPTIPGFVLEVVRSIIPFEEVVQIGNAEFFECA